MNPCLMRMRSKSKMKPLIRVLANAILEARPFVFRARVGAKRHEQDELDAEKWFQKYDELLQILDEKK